MSRQRNRGPGSVRSRCIGGLLTVALFASAFTFVGAAGARADANALTGDESVSVPASWLALSGQTLAQINSAIGSTYRLVDIHQDANGTYTMAAVQNAGAEAVSGWWWYVHAT